VPAEAVPALSSLEGLDGVLPASQARSREARDRLLRAGEKVFAKAGYEAAHIGDIAAAAHCSVGSFYRRFRDKEAFFKALLHRFIDLAKRNAVETFEGRDWSGKTSAEVIRVHVERSLRLFKDNGGFFRALFQLTTAGGAGAYWPLIEDSERFRGRLMAKFLRARAEGGSGLDDACFFAVRVTDGAIVHTVLREVYPSGEEQGAVDDLARMIVGFLGLTQVPKAEAGRGRSRRRR